MLTSPINKKTPKKESNRSNNPPCPGIIEPESFIEESLFIIDAVKSPKNANRIINKTKKI